MGVVTAVLPLATGRAWALSWTEAGDAGDLPAFAQQPGGAGALDSISGTIDSNADADMYRICLTGGGTFSATTVGGTAPELDTQLFLFNAAGAGVFANDDDPVSGPQSTLPAGHALSPAAAGVYYLAVSTFNDDPLDAGGNDIFVSGGFTAVVGPVDGDPVQGWNDLGGQSGDYTIALTGAVPCPADALCASDAPLPPGTIFGTPGNDVLTGTPGDDVIVALAGNDNVKALGGNDVIVGGPGNDLLDGGDGNDVICGGAGNDTLVGGAGDDTLFGENGYDNLLGGAGDDTLSGGALSDRLDGGAGTNSADGGPGSDVCVNAMTTVNCSP